MPNIFKLYRFSFCDCEWYNLICFLYWRGYFNEIIFSFDSTEDGQPVVSENIKWINKNNLTRILIYFNCVTG